MDAERGANKLAHGATTNGSHESNRRLAGPELVQRWDELGLIGCRTDITDPEVHSRRLTEAAQRRTAG